MQMFKIVSAIAVSCLFAINGSSAGFYVGVSGGGDYLKIKVDVKDSKTAETFKIFYEDEVGAFGPNFGLVLGYGYLTSQKIYIGTEFNASMAFATPKVNKTFTKDSKTCTGDHRHTSKYNLGGNVLFGYHFTPNFMVYALTGIEAKYVNTKNINTVKGKKETSASVFKFIWDEAKTVEDFYSEKTNIETNTCLCGVVGLGARYFVTKSVFIGSEFKATFGSKSSLNSSGYYAPEILESAAPVIQKNDDSLSLKIRDYSIGFVVGYKF